MRNSWEDILSIMEQRRSGDAEKLKTMMSVKSHYNVDLVIPLTDVSGEPIMPYANPHLVADIIDHTAMRAASPRPTITCPAMDPTSDRSIKYAQTRRRALYARWHKSALWDVLLYRSYRHLIGYGTNAFAVTWDYEYGSSCIEIRDPLSAYPDERSPEEIRLPTNVGFVYGRSRSWLIKNYPVTAPLLQKNPGYRNSVTDMWDLVEWIDDTDIVVGLLGPRFSQGTNSTFEVKLQNSMELSRVPNRAGLVPCSVPQRVTLDRVMGQVATILDQEDLLGKLTALDIVAAEKAIWGDMVAIGQQGRPPTLLSGKWKDGRTGEINLVSDGDVKVLSTAPGPLTGQILDRVERNANISGGKSPFMTGETTGSLRTGRAIDTLGGYSVDPRIEEAQKLMARGLMQVNEAIMAVEKGNAPNKKFVVFSGWPGDMAHVEYQPSKHFETYENVVAYPMPGTDVQGATVAVVQSVGGGLMSRASGRRKHPLIEDPEFEDAQIELERINDAVLQSMLQQAMAGALPLIDVASIMSKREGGMKLAKAIIEASAEAQERQASQAPPPGEGQAAAPATQPGLALPGQGVEAQPADQVQPPAQDLQDFRSLLVNLQGAP